MDKVELIGLDADDTLWESEIYFAAVEEKFLDLMGKYSSEDDLERTLSSNEISNLRVFGYGVKSFTLSMIETAHRASNGTITSTDIDKIISWGKELLQHPVTFLDGVEEAVHSLTKDFNVFIITKGDLLHQRNKIEESGLDALVTGFEIFHEKDPNSYRDFLEERNISPENFVMAGNSLRSDIFPVTSIGGKAIHIPHDLTWDYEKIVSDDAPSSGYKILERISDLPQLLRSGSELDS
ncbi:MAG TPA: HAD family hydrolase [Acidimicrobiales bacterium]|nr:HAD family hydrolase [Acidimicrobiales bacterium]HJM27935.1 HAD family hydrolase [Acidimicrobiales bacterium]HJM97315.1 HAD family hydrolase [Acidimicrobiales bacterium]